MPQVVNLPKETRKAIADGELLSKGGNPLTEDDIHVETKKERLKRHKRERVEI